MENRNKPQSLLSSTRIGEHFGTSANKTNRALSELGWIRIENKGWQATRAGTALGAVQVKEKMSGNPYVRWPENILYNKVLVTKINEVSGKLSPPQDNQIKSPEKLNFRQKYPGSILATDGHLVKSKSEKIIDDWLYNHNVVHIYEKKLPAIEDVYSDFYIPKEKVYIEFWGIDNDPIYDKRKAKKLETYHKGSFNLIELNDMDINNLEDVFPKKLTAKGIKFD